jgi:type IV pilus assembly protein PilQ
MRKSAYLLFLLALAAARVAAQPAPADNPPANPGDVSIKETEAPKSVVTKGAKDTLSVDFPNEDIRTILRNVADLFDLNLVIPDTLQGKASIKLRDVTWRQIFEEVLTPVGYTFVEKDNIIRVVTNDSVQHEATTTEVYILNYAKAADIQPTIAPMVETGGEVHGKIQIDTRANALIITERPTRLKSIIAILGSLDKPTQQVMIESKFIEITDTDQKNLGVNWSSLSGYGVSAGPFTHNYTQASGVTTSNNTTGTNINVAYEKSGLAAADQVNSAVPLMQPNAIGTFTPGTGGGPSTIGGIGPASLDTQTFTSSIANATTAVFNADQFKVVLSALQSNSATRLISNPTVVTLNNTEAFINSGVEYPIPSYQYSTQTDSFQISGFTFSPIGIMLKVTPQINDKGFIKLKLDPTVSSISSTVTFGGTGGYSIPVIAAEEVQTEVTLKDGNTLGIGGLVSTSREKGHTKIPILGDIPVLGRLFSSKDSTGSADNLIIFITAKTVSPENAMVSDVFDPRLTRAVQLQKDEMPSYRDGSDPFAPPPPPDDSKK